LEQHSLRRSLPNIVYIVEAEDTLFAIALTESSVETCDFLRTLQTEDNSMK
jgi:hypothetical protein